jgi:hypothetical protein
MSQETISEGFVFQQDGVDYLKFCVDVTLCFVGSLSTHTEGVLDFYDQALSIIKGDIVQYETGTMSKPRRIKPDTFDMLPLWVNDSKSKRDMMQLRLDNSKGPDAAADRAFQFAYFDHYKAGGLRLVLPAAFVDESASSLASLAKSLARRLSFSSGLGGYSLNWNKLGELAHEASKEIAVISRRYPGIDVPDLTGDIRVMPKGIKCVNWLTFLNGDLVENLGGSERLSQALKGDIVYDALPNGVVIQAGPRPETGDVNRRQMLPLYHAVGKAVANVRAKEHLPFIPDPKDPDSATSTWLARFDS